MTPVSPSTPVTITYLAMAQQPEPTLPCPAESLVIRRLAQPTARFYRYLYNEVGSRWQWVARRDLNDATLLSLIAPPAVEIHVLFDGSVPAGFVELDRKTPDTAEIRYFGLFDEAIGRGVGRWFLERAVALAWQDERAQRLLVDTCTLDHPRALPLYHWVGFEAYETRTTPFSTLSTGSGSASSSTMPS